MPTIRPHSFTPWLAAVLCLLAAAPALCAADAAIVVSEGSIKPVPQGVKIGPNDPHHAYIKRTALQPAEVAEQIRFEVTLKMRNFPELQARVARGEIIPFEEMAEKYYPSQADYLAVAAWMAGQGFQITRQDDNHLAIFATASVDAIQKALRVNFARVSLEGQDYTSAITAPSIPAGVAPLLVGINGLQPHLQKHKHIVKRPDSLSGTNPPFTPAQILHAYGANALTVTGSGQTIAIVIDTFPNASDLTTFWSTCGVSQSGTNISYIQVVPGTLSSPSGEESLDTEWSSSIAPGAKVRIYATYDLSDANLDTAYQYIFSDAVAHPGYGIHQMTMSYGISEYYTTASQVTTDAQYFANLVSQGITLFASSGDGADNPTSIGSPGGRHVNADSPASDPSITGVGGTSITLTSGSNINSGTAWPDSGGGTSIYFNRPTWQTGTGVSAGTTRCVPDVATPADPNKGGYVELNGSLVSFGGTSWSSPTWAGFCALINQARANVGLPPVGLLGPKIYPLIGTANFQDITAGSNGYSAGVGYDLVTGIGSPNMQNLLPTLVGLQTAPPVTTLTPNQNATFTVASSATATSYQWQRMPIGTSMWSNIPANGTYAGVITASLTINGVTSAMSGDQFHCLVTTGSTVATTAPPSTLVVDNQLVVATLAGQVLVTGTANGSRTNARFNYPSGVAIDSSGNLYIADYSNDTIRKVTPAGVVTTPYGRPGVAGSTDGPGINALFNTPNAVAIDSSNNIYVADSGNNSVRMITPAGAVSTLAGLSGTTTGTANGIGSAAQFNNPQGIAVDVTGSNVYVADTGNEAIRKIVVSSGSVSTLAGTMGTNGYVNGTGTAAQFNGPIGVAVDRSGNVYVTDLYNYVVRKVRPTGVVTGPYGQAGVAGRLDGMGAATQFNSPIGICIDGSGNLYVTDSQVPPVTNSNSTGNNTVRRINPAGVVSTIAGTPGVVGSADGTGVAAQFYSVQAVAVNSSGVVYLADTFNQTMRAGGLAPLITTLEGTQTVTTGQSATFSVKAAGSGLLTYQWYFNGSLISSATGSSYSKPSASPGDAGGYTVAVTDPYGTSTSGTYTLTVTNTIPALPGWTPAALGALIFLAAAQFLRAKQRKTPPARP